MNHGPAMQETLEYSKSEGVDKTPTIHSSPSSSLHLATSPSSSTLLPSTPPPTPTSQSSMRMHPSLTSNPPIASHLKPQLTAFPSPSLLENPTTLFTLQRGGHATPPRTLSRRSHAPPMHTPCPPPQPHQSPPIFPKPLFAHANDLVTSPQLASTGLQKKENNDGPWMPKVWMGLLGQTTCPATALHSATPFTIHRHNVLEAIRLPSAQCPQ